MYVKNRKQFYPLQTHASFSAKRHGLDLNTFWHAIRASAGNSFLWETAGPCIFNGNYHDSFALDLQVKDIQLCYDMAKEAKVREDQRFFRIVMGNS